eukprot:GEMP01020658.1.p2 GENE.GEMP01020658.1~~GEMP01020658.1.p2  ORF type:complete len:107 (-),score=19.90 GEMP01020658.1:2132-2452(-)
MNLESFAPVATQLPSRDVDGLSCLDEEDFLLCTDDGHQPPPEIMHTFPGMSTKNAVKASAGGFLIGRRPLLMLTLLLLMYCMMRASLFSKRPRIPRANPVTMAGQK